MLAVLDGPHNATLDELCASARAQTPLATLRGLCELIPDRYEYRTGVTYVGSTVDEFLQGPASARTTPTSR